MDELVKLVGGIGFFLFWMHMFGGLEPLGELFNKMWGGDVRQLKKENKALKKEIQQLRALSSGDVKSRIETLETIVTDEDHELNKKLGKL